MVALEAAVPLGRVWSFPKKIVLAQPVIIASDIGTVTYYDKKFIETLKRRLER